MRRLALLAGAALLITSCGSGGGGDAGGAPAAGVLKDKVTIEFWHSMKGANAEAINQLVADFHAKFGSKVQIKPVFQGNYDETVAKYKAAVQQENTPALIQIYDIGTRFMIDSKQVVPMYKFFDVDKYSTADIEPNIASYYSVDGKMWSMPFNSSTPLLYINKEAFEKAGMDPNKPPKTLDEITKYAEKLTVKDASGTVKQYGFGSATYGWLLEQLLATDGQEYCDKGNGRQGLATKVQFDSASGAKVADWWHNLVSKGWAVNVGRKTDDGQAIFKSGTVAMHLESTSALRGYVDAAKQNGFTVVTAPYPKLSDGSKGGPIIGGASLWINGVGHSDEEKRAAWEFAKFSATPEEQAKWHVGTGYVAVNPKAYDQEVARTWAAQFPQFATAVDQLHSLPPSTASAGCILGVMPQARQASEEGLEQSILGSKPGAQAMKDAAASLSRAIEQYNQSVK
ncbi:ABC transporter substrate-binding protein [Nonomuraea rhizosphaerae]|uniref:ABC transporter substrate-binding protein n=1 Tax=Nonomuraea rhizosphaerae TaxID=2665663 RepID=UPI001C5F4A0F|nr:ABC transporter substrate-binding protein [Nonomuraea rhizosphaerae]